MSDKEVTANGNGSLAEDSTQNDQSKNIISLPEVEKLTEKERISLRLNKFKSEEELALEKREKRFLGEKKDIITPSDREKRFASETNDTTSVTDEQLKARALRFGIEDEEDKMKERLKRFPEMSNENEGKKKERGLYQPPKRQSTKHNSKRRNTNYKPNNNNSAVKKNNKRSRSDKGGGNQKKKQRY